MIIRIDIRLTSARRNDPWTHIAVERIAGRNTRAVRKTLAANVARGQYDVRVTRTSGYHDENTIQQERIYWTALRSIINESPVHAPAPLALTVLRIRATAQLSGSIDALNAVVTTLVTSWNAARRRWLPRQPSDNPADLYRHVLQGPANKKPIPTRAIDLEALQEWHAYCAGKGFTFNQYRDRRASVWSTLADICTAGRASPTFVDGKWSVIWDDADAPIVQHFTPVNSSGFRASRGYADRIQALRVRFIDAENDWQQDERLVHADGYNEANTDHYEAMEFPGVTDRDLIWRHGRYHLAQIALRREVYEITTDFEHLACVRGDRVLLTHDVPKIGLAFGRVKAVHGNRLTLDAPVAIDGQNIFVLRIRHDDGTPSEQTIATQGPAETNMVDLVADREATAPAAGDLFAFGYYGRTSTVCRVKAIRPAANMAARLELVDDAPAIHEADPGPIPAFSPNISEPVDLYNYPPRDLTGTAVLELAENRLVAGVRLSWTPPPAAGVASYIVEVRRPGGEARDIINATGNSAVIGDLDGGRHVFRARAAFAGRLSRWSGEYSVNVDGPFRPPPDVTEFRAVVSGETLTLSWAAPPDIVTRDYAIRVTANTTRPTWWAALPLREGLTGNTLTIPYRPGAFLIRARSWNDVPADNATIAIVNVTPISAFNVVETASDAPPFNGTHSGTAYNAALRAIALATRTMRGTYTLSQRIDLTAVMTVRLSAQVLAGGHRPAADFLAVTDFFARDDFFDDDPSQWSVTAQVRTTRDDPDSDDPAWSAWSDLVAGDVAARAFQFRIILETRSADIIPIVTNATFTADVPDRFVTLEDVVSGTTPYRITFDPPFRVLKTLQITAQDLDSGDRWRITDKSPSSAAIAFFDINNNPVSRVFDAQATGYGSLQ